MALQSKRLTLQDAIIKIRTYCNYRERSHHEVRDKLYRLGVWTKDVDLAIAQMIEEGLLNEERYARSFARGHFYIKKWGRQKIIVALRQQKIGERLIKSAFEEIDDADYQKTIKQLLIKKLTGLKGHNFEKRSKVSKYLLQKGYSYNEITPILNELLNTEKKQSD